jgi:hypothetical protein
MALARNKMALVVKRRGFYGGHISWDTLATTRPPASGAVQVPRFSLGGYGRLVLTQRVMDRLEILETTKGDFVCI